MPWMLQILQIVWYTMNGRRHALLSTLEMSQSADWMTLCVAILLVALIVLTLPVSVFGTQTSWNAKSHLSPDQKTSRGSDGMHGLCTARMTLICVVLTCQPFRRFLVKALQRPLLMALKLAFLLLDRLKRPKYLRTTSVAGLSKLIPKRNTSYQSNGTSTLFKNNLS